MIVQDKLLAFALVCWGWDWPSWERGNNHDLKVVPGFDKENLEKWRGSQRGAESTIVLSWVVWTVCKVCCSRSRRTLIGSRMAMGLVCWSEVPSRCRTMFPCPPMLHSISSWLGYYVLSCRNRFSGIHSDSSLVACETVVLILIEFTSVLYEEWTRGFTNM